MSPERVIGWIFAAVALILLVWLAVVVIDRIDEDNDPGLFDPSVFVAALE